MAGKTNSNGTRKVSKSGVVTYPGYTASKQVRRAAADSLGGFDTNKKRKK